MSRVSAPPGRSLWDASQPTLAASTAANTVPDAQNTDIVGKAMKDMQSTARDDFQRYDLKDLLVNSSREAQYSELPAGWPSVLSQEAAYMRPMPDMVMDKYKQCQATCFSGVFPEIQYAWASIDNLLYIWDTTRASVPVQWQEQQAICIAGLTKPKPNVFQQAVQYLMVVCTTVEISLVGVNIRRDDNGNAELKLLNLELFTAPSDDVTMTAITCTPEGRIFLGGSDSNLYELEYRSQASWRKGRCNKVCYTGGFAAYLPSLAWPIFRRATAVMQIAIDQDRQILYTRSQAGVIVVFDMGPAGSGPLKRVTEIASVLTTTDRGQNASSSALVLVAPIPPSESSSIHLMAVTADGRRVYLSTQPTSGALPGNAPRRPSCLNIVFNKSAIPAPASQGNSRSLNITVAAYNHGALLLADTLNEGRSRVILVSRDLTIPPVGGGSHPGLRELVCEVSPPVPGEVLAFGATPQAKPLLPVVDNSIKSELATQHVTPKQEFMVMTTAGATQVSKLRPVDVLNQILQQDSPGKLEQFFACYGPAEASAMCYFVASSNTQEATSVVVEKARAALLNPGLTGEAAMPNGNTNNTSRPASHGAFNMGEVVQEANKPEWSGGHRGLQTYIQRLVHPMWDNKLVVPSKIPHSLVTNLSEESLKALQVRLRSLSSFLLDFQKKKMEQLRKARAKPASYFGHTGLGRGFGQLDSKGRANPPAKRQRLDDPVAQEADRTKEVTALVCRASEACYLMRVLIGHQLPRLTMLLEDKSREELQKMSLKELICSKEGEHTISQLITVLINEHQQAAGVDDGSLSSTLQQGCPSYFREEDKLYFAASGELRRAQTLQGSQRQDVTRAALEKLIRVSQAVDMAQVTPLLVELGAYDGLVALAVAKAKALDPESVATQRSEAGSEARLRRDQECYAPVIQVLKFLVNPDIKEGAGLVLAQQGLSAEAVQEAKAVILKKGAYSKDMLFVEQLLTGLVAANAIKDVQSLSQAPGMFSTVHKHLLKAGTLPSDGKPSLHMSTLVGLNPLQVASLDMLARVYVEHDKWEEAAAVYNALASRTSNYNEPSVNLNTRLDLFRMAKLQGQTMGSSDITTAMDFNCRLMEVQIQLVEELTALQASGTLPPEAPSDLGLRVRALQEAPQPLPDLFNQYAAPYHQWASCLELVHVSDGVDSAYVQQLWDLHLKKGYDTPGLQSLQAKRDEVFQRLHQVSARLYPSQTALPLDHIALRLEQISAGTWPQRDSPLTDARAVPEALVKACSQEPQPVQQAYGALLGRTGGDQNAPDVRSPVLRMRVLKSVHSVLLARHDWLEQQQCVQSDFRQLQRRELAEMMAACEEFGLEASRLQHREAVQVEQLFSELRDTLRDELKRVSRY